MVAKSQKRRLIRLLSLVALLFLALPARLSAQQQTEPADSLVRLLNAEFVEQFEVSDSVLIRKAVGATFLHNGTYLICDSSLWNTNTEIINCIGNVRLMQGDTELTSDKLDYLIKEDLAQFRGAVVQLRNRNDNILRTRHLDYNTRDSLAIFNGGAAMRSEDGQVIESDNGRYSSISEVFNFVGNVNMYTDSVFVRTDSLLYNSETSFARFVAPIDFWNEDKMLSARAGWYDRQKEIFFFENQVHGLGESQESWSDSLYFYRNTNDVLMLGHAQVQDTTRSSISLSDYLYYQDSLSRVTLKNNAAVAIWEETENKIDTTFIGADTLIYHTVRRCDIADQEVKNSDKRRSDFRSDPVSEFRRRAAQAAADAAASRTAQSSSRPTAKKSAANQSGPSSSQSSASSSQASDTSSDSSVSLNPAPDSIASASNESLRGGEADETISVHADSLAIAHDKLPLHADSLSIASDSLSVLADSSSIARDSLIASSDSLAVQLDTSRVGFIIGIGNVKVFREDMQVRCDSLRFNELDSIARLYRQPLVWNEGRRQYSSDSLFVLIGKNGVEKANLMSNAFISVMEDSTHFDQIKSSEVLAYFGEDTQLSRFDALGGVSALFYITENDALATVNKVEAKMLSATMKEGELERVHYFDSPKNDAYPIVQLPAEESILKGFKWNPDLRPASRHDISSLRIRPTQRAEYEAHPRSAFPHTDNYFPGYIAELQSGLARAAERKRIAQEQEEQAKAAKTDTTQNQKLNTLDSLKFSSDSIANTPSLRDSLQVSSDSTKVTAPTAKEDEYMSESELRRAMRIAERDARWARQDARDKARAAERKAKADARKARREARKAARKAAKDKKDEALLQKYIDYYQKQKESDERRQQKLDSSQERGDGTEAGGGLQAPNGAQ